MIILGLQWSVNDAELRRYFEQFGEVAAAEVMVTPIHVHVHVHVVHACNYNIMDIHCTCTCT